MQFVYRNWRMLLVGVAVLLFTTTACPQGTDAGVRAKAATALGAAGDVNGVELLIPMLKDTDPGVRKAAAAALGKLDDGRAIHPLFSVLRTDTDHNVRLEAELAISRTWDLAASDPLLEELRSDDPATRKEATHQLTRFPEPRVNERLAEVMANDAADNVREEAVRALGSLRDPRAVEPLLKLALRDTTNAETRDFAIKALGAIGDARAIEPLQALLPKADKYFRNKIYDALGHISVTAILPALSDKDPFIREQVALLLRRLGDPRAIDPLITALQDQDLKVRNAAIYALGSFNNSRTIKPLVAILRKMDSFRDPDVEKQREDDSILRNGSHMQKTDKVDDITLRCNTASSLGNIDDPLAVTALVEACNDKEHWVREAAIWRLQQHMNHPLNATALLPLLTSAQTPQSSTLLNILARTGGARITDYLISLLQSTDPTIRQNTLCALINNNSDTRIPAILLTALHDHDSMIRSIAASGLGNLKVIQATEPLLQMLATDTDQDARANAASALGVLKAIKAEPALFAMLQETENLKLFRQACFALADIGDPKALPALLMAAKNPDPSWRREALGAIGRFDDTTVTTVLLDALNDPDANIRSIAVWSLASHQEAGITETLIGLLNDTNPGVRSAAVEALGKRGDVKAVEPLLALLRRDPYSCIVVAKALGLFKDPRAVRTLITAYYDPEHLGSYTIIPALGAIGNDRAKAELTRIINLRRSLAEVEEAQKALAVVQAGKN